ncbi:MULTISPECIES: HVO_A0114 family putative DNA-binding protein [unclassified Methylobacterium]|uniref:HVO_A0114 family putative DNA-binding protein n=1 Tax=unclassified Methylobacterium TaxID=2615210 RepID=UPI001355E26D|nr:hypothetical protein [Methylobacterium sp. 2A]MWV24817.1 hypothetical protein [Methylobacterium sp. 2A]
MSGEITFVIGGSVEDMRARFLSAVRRAEAGEAVEPERVVTFENWATFLKTFSAARIALLEALAAGPADSINALAGALGRNYRRVHDDVAALERAGLLKRTGTRVMLAAEGACAHLDLRPARARRQKVPSS